MKHQICRSTTEISHHSNKTMNQVVVSNIFLFSPLPGEDEPILTNIFQMGCNHQADEPDSKPEFFLHAFG